MPLATCHILRLGLVEYAKALDVQQTLLRLIHIGEQPNTLLLLEHPDVYTIGRRGTREHVLLDDKALQDLGIDLQYCDRGGQATFHGPGQLVAYPVVNLRDWGGPIKYVRTLEQVMVKTLMEFNITPEVTQGLTGVWVNGAKIGSIGVKISRGIAYHGISLNVNNHLPYFRHILACGIADARVTSLERLLGESVEVDLVAYGISYHLGREMGFQMVDGQHIPDEISQHTYIQSL